MEKAENNMATNPFRVPDGYFDQLKSDIMARVAPRHAYLRPLIGVAASVCVAIFGVSVYLHSERTRVASPGETATTSEFLFASDDATDYIMLDNEDIYRYLSGIE